MGKDNKDNRVKTTLYTTENKKDFIKQKAQLLQLSISDLLCFIGSNLDTNKKTKEQLHKISNSSDSKAKNNIGISFRTKQDDLNILEEKAKELELSLNDFLINASILFEVEVSFKEVK